MELPAPLTPNQTRVLLERLGLSPSRRRGQNFLVDGNIVRKSLELAQVQAGDRIVEIGPGLGTLTQALLAAGAEVFAIEVDRGIHAYLAAEIVPPWNGRFHLKEGDALESPLAGVPTDTPFKIVANLPYAISTPWMDRILAGPLPRRMVLMLQREAADRYTACAGSKSFGAISILLQAAFEVEPGHRVSPACFWPRPEVESTLLNLRLRPEPRTFGSRFRELLRTVFGHRRKQLLSSLKEAGAPVAVFSAWLEREGLSQTVRAEEVPLSAWLQAEACLGER